MKKEYSTIKNAETPIDCRCWIGIILMSVYEASPPGNRWDFLVSPFSTSAVRWNVFKEEVLPFVPRKDAEDIESLLIRWDKAVAA